jgi:hypothetical protein
MAVQSSPPTHPVVACAEEIGVSLGRVASVEPGFMTSAEKAAALVELSVQAARLEELRLRVLADADDVAEQSGARSATAWLAHATRQDTAATCAAGRLAEGLGRWSRVAAGMATGVVNAAQARVLVEALDELPADLEPGLVAKAEAYLVEQAEQFPPAQLKTLGLKVLEVIAPDVAERHERERLERAEAHAARKTSLRFRHRGDGTTDLHARMSDAVAGRLRTYLDALTAPRRDHLERNNNRDEASGERVGRDRLLGEAFGALLEHLDPAALPRHGGKATTVVVTIDLERLLSRLGAAGLGTGEQVTASEAMRLACTANLVPMVLGGRGEVLHQGRAKRLFTPAQRLAMAVRDKTCRAAGCTVPASWAEAHHRHPWTQGGKTDLDDGVSLCPWHHHRAHDPAYTTEYLASGGVRFHRRR